MLAQKLKFWREKYVLNFWLFRTLFWIFSQKICFVNFEGKVSISTSQYNFRNFQYNFGNCQHNFLNFKHNFQYNMQYNFQNNFQYNFWNFQHIFRYNLLYNFDHNFLNFRWVLHYFFTNTKKILLDERQSKMEGFVSVRRKSLNFGSPNRKILKSPNQVETRSMTRTRRQTIS